MIGPNPKPESIPLAKTAPPYANLERVGTFSSNNVFFCSIILNSNIIFKIEKKCYLMSLLDVIKILTLFELKRLNFKFSLYCKVKYLDILTNLS
ncbi:MAG: hypothetical protein CEE42_15490 [Promethearchaeota archaeon Loki_b31]|nr:MAG: hypothetical protein CEE42_15490 [Candidatus Lokiarchaeota archaeon Loki_b31]